MRFAPPADPMAIHFNYFPGDTKRAEMEKLGCWFADDE